MTLTNAEIKNLSKLKDRSGREKQRLFMVEGKRAVMEALDSDIFIEMVITDIGKDAEKFADVFKAAGEKGIKLFEVPSTKFRKLEATENSQGIVAIARMPDWSLDEFLSRVRSAQDVLILFLDQVSDPGNVGSILRTAEWFNLDAVVLNRGSVDVFNPKVVRSSMSALTRINVFSDIEFDDIWHRLKEMGFEFYCAMQKGGEFYFQTAYAKKALFVFGSEANGINEKIVSRCTKRISIPQFGKMESLNVSVAAAIIISDVIRRRSVNAN